APLLRWAGARDRLSGRAVAGVVDGAGEQGRHPRTRGLAVESGRGAERDRLGQQRDRVIRGEDGGRVVQGAVDASQVERVAVKVAGQLHQLVAQEGVGVDAEVGAGDI